LLLVAVLAATLAIVLASFGGTFASYATAEARLPAGATAVSLGAPVEYRNVTVGSVASQGRAIGHGVVSVTLHLQRSMLASIPRGVRATETPVSFFGDAYIVLVPPAHPVRAGIRPGAVIPELKVGQTASLQSTLGDLDTLLTKLRPGELDAALTALAGSLAGNGTSLGHNLVTANTYFAQMQQLWPTTLEDLGRIVPVADQFASSTPDLLQILANQTTTAGTIDDLATTVQGAISGGDTLAGQAAQLLDQIQQPYTILAADSGPFLQAISQNPQEISQLLAGLDAWAKAWSAALASGPYLDITQNQAVVNPADLGLAVLGGPEAAAYLDAGLGPGTANPPTYPSAGTIPTVAPAQSGAVAQIAAALGGARPASPAVATLLLSPVLEALVTRR
jgi:phospholipid/cholesterol/gamma-HCH transport system substrate-binding protein